MTLKRLILRRLLSLKLNNRLRHKLVYKLASYEGGEAFSQSLRDFYWKEYGIKIGYGTYGGCFDKINFPANVSVGNYCSVAQGVKVFRANHPVDSFTSHPLFYNPSMGYVEEDKLLRPPLIIGHDVWIGANVIICPSCKVIGNGAVIGAGSVVTKDVEPYSVVAGNPAKEIRKRFNKAQIEFLEESRWWNFKKEQLIEEFDTLQERLIKFE